MTNGFLSLTVKRERERVVCDAVVHGEGDEILGFVKEFREKERRWRSVFLGQRRW